MLIKKKNVARRDFFLLFGFTHRFRTNLTPGNKKWKQEINIIIKMAFGRKLHSYIRKKKSVGKFGNISVFT